VLLPDVLIAHGPERSAAAGHPPTGMPAATPRHPCPVRRTPCARLDAATEGEAVTAADPAPFRAAAEAGDVAALADLLTEDVRLYSPVKFAPFVGKPLVVGLLRVLIRTFQDFRYIGRFDGSAEATGDGTPAPSAVLVFRCTVNGREIHGIDMLQFAADGRIREITVMVRPQSAVHTLGEAILAGLIADGLAPPPASATAPTSAPTSANG
jgi:hypothetical protein